MSDITFDEPQSTRSLAEQYLKSKQERAGGDEKTRALADMYMRQRAGEEARPDELALTLLGQDKFEGEGGGAGLRFYVNLLGDNFEEQQAAFQRLHPNGDLRAIPQMDGNLYVYRTGPREPYKKLDPGFVESLGLGFKGFMKEMGGDIADLGGSSPEIIGETALQLLLKRAPGSGKFLGDLARLAGGAMLGEAGQQFLQTAMDTQRQSLKEQARLVAGAGTESIIGTTLGAGFGSLVNMTRGRMLASKQPEAIEAVEATERLGIPRPLPTVLTDIPLLRLIGRQSQASVPSIGRYLTESERRTADALKAMIRDSDKASFIQKTATALKESQDALVDGLLKITQTTPRSLRAGGRAVQQGIEDWWKVSGRDVDNLYSVARSIEEPQFDYAPLLAKAREVEAGVAAPVVDDATIGIVGEGTKTFRVSEIEPGLQSVLDDIMRIDPNLPTVTRPDGSTVTPTQYLRELRKRVDDLTLAGPEGIREAQRRAIEVKAAIQSVLDNPVNESPQFVAAWKVANRAAAQRFRTREKMAVLGAAKSESPAKLAQALAHPGKLDDLVLLRKALGKDGGEKWARFQESFQTRLLSDPLGMKAALDAFDEPTLNMLLPPNKRFAYREAANRLDRLNEPGMRAALQNQSTLGGFIRGVMSDPLRGSQITLMNELIVEQGGKSSPLGKMMRAAVIDMIWNRSKTVAQGVERVDFNGLQTVMKDFEESGLMSFLEPGDVSRLNDIKLIQDFNRLSADAGTSIQAAEQASAVRGALFGQFSDAGFHVLENIGMGRLLTNDKVIRVFTRTSGRDRTDARVLKLLGAIATNISNDAEGQEKLGGEVLRLIGLNPEVSTGS